MYLITASLALAALACGPGADSEVDGVVSRQIESLPLELQWRRGGPVEDSVLYQPWVVRAAEEQTVVLDRGGYRVRAFDAATGEVIWSVGRRGQGPMEFSSPADLFWDGQGWGVWDDRNARITLLHPDGDLRSERIIRSDERPSRFCSLPGGRLATLLQSDDAAAAVVEPDGSMVALQDWPWRELTEVYSLQRPAKWASDELGTCAGYLTLSTGFALFTGDGFQSGHRYIEALDPPDAEAEEFSGGVSVGLTEIPTLAVRDAFFHEGELWLLFGGHTEDASRLLDVYNPQDGSYQRSYRLPFRDAQQIARNGDQLFVTRTREGYPVLEAYRITEPTGNSTASTR